MKELINIFDQKFREMHQFSVDFVASIPKDKLFWKPENRKHSFEMFSCGEFILRSAAAVEQTFGGITSRLWDDPFEWTLPEELSTNDKIQEYLREVEKTRQTGFSYFASDTDFYKTIPAPEKMQTIGALIVDTIVRAGHFQGRAWTVRQLLLDQELV